MQQQQADAAAGSVKPNNLVSSLAAVALGIYTKRQCYLHFSAEFEKYVNKAFRGAARTLDSYPGGGCGTD